MSPNLNNKIDTFRAILRYLDISAKNIYTNNASALDFQNIQEIMGYLGVNDNVFTELLSKYSFKNWEEFVVMRNGIYHDTSRTEPIISFLTGFIEGTKDRLNKEISEAENSSQVPA